MYASLTLKPAPPMAPVLVVMGRSWAVVSMVQVAALLPPRRSAWLAGATTDRSEPAGLAMLGVVRLVVAVTAGALMLTVAVTVGALMLVVAVIVGTLMLVPRYS